MSGDFELRVSIPLDSDGFLRRECPTCEREFKWLNGSEDGEESEAPPDGGYFCPYCRIQAPSHTWMTKAQVALIENTVGREVVDPALDGLRRSIANLNRRSGGLIKVKAELRTDTPERMDPLTEPDDMRRVDFDCHPREPVKVIENWDRPVHCLLCGRAYSSA